MSELSKYSWYQCNECLSTLYTLQPKDKIEPCIYCGGTVEQITPEQLGEYQEYMRAYVPYSYGVDV